jgi:hypothetical protein
VTTTNTPIPPPPNYAPTAGITTWWTPEQQLVLSLRTQVLAPAPIPADGASIEPEPETEPSRSPFLKPGAMGALAKTTAVAGLAVAAPFSTWGSLTFTWTHLVWLIGGREHGTPGAHLLAGATCTAGVVMAWAVDPGSADDTGKRRWRIAIKHYLSRILRWAVTCGSLLYLPVAVGVIHLTTGAH